MKLINPFICEKCESKKILLFHSTMCEWCESPPKGIFYVGYVILGDSMVEYVWKTAYEAVRWRSILNTDNPIRMVLSKEPIPWTTASGKASGLQAADRLFEIFPDHKFVQRPYRAFLASEGMMSTSETIEL